MRPLARFTRILAALFFASVALLGLAGCAEDPNSRDASQLPWGRQASWEGQGPGMGSQAPKY